MSEFIPGLDAWICGNPTNEEYELLCERVNDLKDEELKKWAIHYDLWSPEETDVNDNTIEPNYDDIRAELIDRWGR
jgi:hypothetical protein